MLTGRSDALPISAEVINQLDLLFIRLIKFEVVLMRNEVASSLAVPLDDLKDDLMCIRCKVHSI
jgi:hypothetical protein